MLAVSATYSALKRGFPKSIKLWLTVHCIPGTLSLILVTLHLINKVERIRPSYFLSFLAFLLMAIIVVGGIAGRYVRVRGGLLAEIKGCGNGGSHSIKG